MVGHARPTFRHAHWEHAGGICANSAPTLTASIVAVDARPSHPVSRSPVKSGRPAARARGRAAPPVRPRRPRARAHLASPVTRVTAMVHCHDEVSWPPVPPISRDHPSRISLRRSATCRPRVRAEGGCMGRRARGERARRGAVRAGTPPQATGCERRRREKVTHGVEEVLDRRRVQERVLVLGYRLVAAV